MRAHMRWVTLMPRLLLCAVLVLNGTSAVAASIAMLQQFAQADAAPACHAQGESSSDSHEAGLDCCKGGHGNCQCTFVMGVAATLQLPIAAHPHTSDIRSLSAGHLPPLLPDPVRPPIA